MANFTTDVRDIPFQKFLFKKGLNKEAKTEVGVILTLIYGVRSVAAQTEAGIYKRCILIEKNFPEVAKLLRKRRYVDDIARSFKSKEDRAKMAEDLDLSLDKVSMKIKGYTNSGELPPENCTKDGISVTMLGYKLSLIHI